MNYDLVGSVFFSYVIELFHQLAVFHLICVLAFRAIEPIVQH
jgi:hypothetical protein